MMTVYGASARRVRQGWFFGLTGAQVFLVLGAAFPVWLAMAMGQWMALTVLLPLWAGTAALICIPIRGWSAAQWIGVVARHVAGQAAGWTSWQSNASGGELEDPAEADLPGILTAIQIHDGPPMRGQRPAIVQNHATRTWGATARVAHPGIGMRDDDERDVMGAGLAELLEASSASNQIHLIAIQVRTVPDDGTERAEWVRQNAKDQEPRISAEIHAQLDGVVQGAAVRSETFVTIVVHEDVIGKDAKRAGRGVAGRARILYGILGEVETRLSGSLGCTKVEWLDSASLAIAIRTGFEPGDAPALADAAIHHQHDPSVVAGVPVAAAGPSTATTAMRSYRHGDWESVATNVLLPRKGARMGALAHTLVPSQMGERRALTVFYEPISHRQADRGTGRAEMSAAMGTELRRKVGRNERARDRHATSQLRDTDEKLESGRSLTCTHAVLSLTIPETWNAYDFARRLDASVRTSGFTPLPLDGAHDAAFVAATIPLGAGLPRRRKRR